MNKTFLNDFMARNGYLQADFAPSLGIHKQTFYLKSRNQNQCFTIKEAKAIVDRYQLTPEEAFKLFFENETPLKDK